MSENAEPKLSAPFGASTKWRMDIRQWRVLLMPAVAVAAFVLLEWLSFMHEHKGVPVTPWNPGLGFLFALMLVRGPGYAGVLFCGVILAELVVLQTRLSWPLILGIALIISAVYGGTAYLARRYGRLELGMNRLSHIIVVLGAGAAGAMLATVMLPLLLVLDVDFGWQDVRFAFLPLFLGDVIGIAVISPLLLRLIGVRDTTVPGLLRRPEVLLHALLVMAGMAIIAGIGLEAGIRHFYLLFVPVILSGVRFGIDGACLSLAFTQFALVGLLRAHGSDTAVFTEFQTLMFVLSGTGLTVGAVVSERQNANARARAAEARLRDMEAKAAQADRFHLVSGMASALAHEINQPMTAARALARSAQHILDAGDPDLKRARVNLAKVMAQIDHASSVLRRMRDFLRRGQPHRSKVEVRPMIADALLLVEAEARAKHISLRLRVPENLPEIRADRVQLQQVVLNLVRNAIDSISEAEQRKGQVDISAFYQAEPERIEISVADNGPGLGPDFAERVFEPLMTSKHGGLGLGLPICVSIVESHGGKVWLHSGRSGATEFRFSIPLNTSAAN
ncbi:sensor histidine kinase [Terrihabitans rhizophilus]|uniref:histidine kinase n=1 Tax=Terrihabitans rhizophilus TaxID=3092662 RepID=A0ABU4RQM5_9HYPH|nr:ATP-binding protein [Terrihabitans sp. PJ23]MDX6806493.1 ATP-binding protein [Terrihabitans sp. PJ23]